MKHTLVITAEFEDNDDILSYALESVIAGLSLAYSPSEFIQAELDGVTILSHNDEARSEVKAHPRYDEIVCKLRDEGIKLLSNSSMDIW